jgi:hypothetical protein
LTAAARMRGIRPSQIPRQLHELPTTSKGRQGAPSYSQSFYYNYGSNEKIQAIPPANNRPHTEDQIKKDKNGKEWGK